MFAKQPIEEWANGMAAVVNGHRREAAVLFHEFSELDQHLVVGLAGLAWICKRPRKLSHTTASETNSSLNRLEDEERFLRDYRHAGFPISWMLI